MRMELMVKMLLALMLTGAVMAEPQRRARRLPGRRSGNTGRGSVAPSRTVRGPHRRPSSFSSFPPPPPGRDLIVPAVDAPPSAFRRGFDGVRSFQQLLSGSVVSERNGVTPATPSSPSLLHNRLTVPPPPPTRPPSTRRPALSREQRAMLRELQSILGDKPMPIDTTTEQPAVRPRGEALPRFPPYGNHTAASPGAIEGEAFTPSHRVSGFSGGVRQQQPLLFPEQDAESATPPWLTTRAPSISQRESATPPWFATRTPSILGSENPIRAAGAEYFRSQDYPNDPGFDAGLKLQQTEPTTELPLVPTEPSVEATTYSFRQQQQSTSPLVVGFLTSSPARRNGLRPHRGHRLTSSDSVPARYYSDLLPPSAGTTTLAPPVFIPFGNERQDDASGASGARRTSSSSSDRQVARRHDDELDDRLRSIMPQQPDLLCETDAQLGYCETLNQYPGRYMDRVLDQCSTILDYLYSPIPEDDEATLDYRAGAPDDARASGGDGGNYERQSRSGGRLPWSWASFSSLHADVCDSRRGQLTPTYAQARDGRWYVIVQRGVVRQRVSVTTCGRPGGYCRAVAECSGRRSKCLQQFYHRTLIAADPRLPTKCPRMHTFRFPAGCQCQVEDALSVPDGQLSEPLV